MGLMVALGTVVLLNQSKYTDGASLSSVADDIGLSLFEAQTYGVSVRAAEVGSTDFTAAYGISFNIMPSGSNQAYIFFLDKQTKNFIYDGSWNCPPSGTPECLMRFNIERGNIISRICTVSTADALNCGVGRVDISFFRPETEANIKVFDLEGNLLTPSDLKGAKIYLESPNGLKKVIVVYVTGQISVQDTV